MKNNTTTDKGYTLINFCEFDKYAAKSYCAIHDVDESLNLGDITKVDENNLEPFNMICGGSPCFPAGTKVLTSDGEKNIEDIKVGDQVLTHEGRYKEVTDARWTGLELVYRLQLHNKAVFCTSNHKFLVIRPGANYWKPVWLEYQQLTLNDLVCQYDSGGFSYAPIMLLSRESNREVRVYDLTVADDHSFIANGFVVHNCQDFSVAGKQAGSKWKCKDCGNEYNPLTVHYSTRHKCPNCGSENLDKTRSSLLVEWLRIIRANKPRWGIYENVKNIVGKQFKETFQMFLDELHEYGYNTYFQVLNAKDYGVPQNRERVYLIIILKEFDNGKFKFPEPFDNGLRLKDVLEDEVDEKYYINTPQAQTLIDELILSGKLDKDISNTVRSGGEAV